MDDEFRIFKDRRATYDLTKNPRVLSNLREGFIHQFHEELGRIKDNNVAKIHETRDRTIEEAQNTFQQIATNAHRVCEQSEAEEHKAFQMMMEDIARDPFEYWMRVQPQNNHTSIRPKTKQDVAGPPAYLPATGVDKDRSLPPTTTAVGYGHEHGVAPVANMARQPYLTVPGVVNPSDTIRVGLFATRTDSTWLTGNMTDARKRFIKEKLGNLKRRNCATHFKDPVPKEAYPGYYDTVSEYMDLGTLTGKLNNDEYDTVEAFLKDFNLIYQASLRFNGPKHPVTEDASALYDALMEDLSELPGVDQEYHGKARGKRGQTSSDYVDEGNSLMDVINYGQDADYTDTEE